MTAGVLRLALGTVQVNLLAWTGDVVHLCCLGGGPPSVLAGALADRLLIARGCSTEASKVPPCLSIMEATAENESSLIVWTHLYICCPPVVLPYFQNYLLVIKVLLACRWCLASLLYFLLCCSAGHLWPHVPSCLV